MKLLAVETSSIACSVALQVDDDVQEQHVVEAKAHTRILMPMIKTLLDDAGLNVVDLDALVLGNGPGSFIGMRIGASVVQGLAYAAKLNIVPISSLACIAADVFHNHAGDNVAIAQDARMSQVYFGCFERDDAGLPVAMGAERIHDLAEIEALSELADLPWLAAGAGWQRYPTLATLQRPELTVLRDFALPRATDLLGLAQASLESGKSISPEQLQPAYLREQVAVPPAPR
jgi:tRNA threonylcarbamoyladenosine biosynthesis protein TsaB